MSRSLSNAAGVAPSVAVIGGGLVGLATAFAVLRRNPRARVSVLEKETAVARHQSGHNSGVLHAGLYYAPGSSKAALSVAGLRAMIRYCEARGVRYEQCGKLVVAADTAEVERLKALHERGTANGLAGLRWLSAPEAREVEPEVRCVAALRVPEEGIVDYPAVAAALVQDIEALGGEVRTGSGLRRAVREGSGWRLITASGEQHADFVVNCAGLHSDRVAARMGVRTRVRIVPFRGDYYHLVPERRSLVRNLIYPVPDPAFPFLGVHFTRTVAGEVECGPTAVLALKREGYGRADVDLRDAFDAVTFRGLWRFMARHPTTVAAEFVQAGSKQVFLRRLQRLIPALSLADLGERSSGVRAQAMSGDGRLVADFMFADGHASVHVLNAPSPAATASLVIGEHIANRMAGIA